MRVMPEDEVCPLSSHSLSCNQAEIFVPVFGVLVLEQTYFYQQDQLCFCDLGVQSPLCSRVFDSKGFRFDRK